MQVMNPCFVCECRDYIKEFSGRIINDHLLFKCSDCGVVIAKPCDINAKYDYNNYGDYLIKGNRDKQLAAAKWHHHALYSQIYKQFGAQASILDIGCGAGFFVKAAQAYGFKAVGVEPSEMLRTFATETFGLEPFASMNALEGTFDVVTMIEVIEHVPSEMNRVVVSDALKKLNKGGIFYGSTPNFNSLNIAISKENDRVIWPPQHCCYFTPRALDRYLSSMGLRKKTLYTKGFEGFRKTKTKYSFIETPHISRFFRFTVVYPFKILFRAISMVAGPLGKGHGIHFMYHKD